MPVKNKTTATNTNFELAAPDSHYVAEKYVVKLPLSDSHFNDDLEKMRLYITEVLEKQLGDEVQLAAMKIKRPHIAAKTKARLLRQEPCARMIVTVRF